MSQREIPDWILKLLPVNGEPVQLSDEDFLKLDSFLPEQVSRIWTTRDSPSKSAIEQHNELMARLVVLRNFNRKLREAIGPDASLPPTSSVEAEAQGYVECKIAYELLGFRAPDRLTAYLDKRTDSIRQFKPTDNRRMVHAADLLRIMFKEKDLKDEGKDEMTGEPKRRRNSPPGAKTKVAKKPTK